MAYMDWIRLPARIEALGMKGRLVAVHPRTKHTRIYVIEWDDGTTKRYKGGANRPWWIEHIKQAPIEK